MGDRITYYTRKVRKYGVLGSIAELWLRLRISFYRRSSAVRRSAIAVTRSREATQWVFVLGCYNSGTTLLARLLSAHPEVRSLPREGVRLTGALRTPEDLGWTRMYLQCSEYVEADDRLGSREADLVRAEWSPWWKGDGAVCLEKSITDLLRPHWLATYFPNAYFVGISREGYSVAEGIVRRARPKGPAREVFGDKYSLRMAAEEWRDANLRLIDLEKDLDRLHRIRYEDLVRDPVSVLRRVYGFLRLPVCEIEQTDSGIRIAGHHYQLFDGNSRSRSGLSQDEIESIHDIVEPVHVRLGYGPKELTIEAAAHQ